MLTDYCLQAKNVMVNSNTTNYSILASGDATSMQCDNVQPVPVAMDTDSDVTLRSDEVVEKVEQVEFLFMLTSCMLIGKYQYMLLLNTTHNQNFFPKLLIGKKKTFFNDLLPADVKV